MIWTKEPASIYYYGNYYWMQIQMSSILLWTLQFNCPIPNKEIHKIIIPECCQNEIAVSCVVKDHPYLYTLTKAWQNLSFRLSKLPTLSHLTLLSTITFNSLLKETAGEIFSVVLIFVIEHINQIGVNFLQVTEKT